MSPDSLAAWSDSKGHERPSELRPSLRLAQVAVFSALIAVGTTLPTALLGLSLPFPLSEITLAPAFYMAIAVLFPRRVAISSTAIGSAIGEAVNILVFGVVPASIALSFVPGIVIARAPEVFIIQRFRQRTTRWVAFGMGLATVYETLAFFFIDWPIYTFTSFYASFYCTQPPCGSAGFIPGFGLAAFDFGTLIDLAWIPVAFAIITATRRAFRIQFFQ